MAKLNETDVIKTDKGQEFTVGEIQHSNRIVKSATPKQDLSWYVKRSAQGESPEQVQTFLMADRILSLFGCMGWTWVGFLWKDRALIVLNAVIVFTLGVSILGSLI